MPGNPVDLLITSNPNVKAEDVIRLKRLRGLDKPWYVQYVRWIFGYKEPARPPVVLLVPDQLVTHNGDGPWDIDLSEYLVDQNFMPKSDDMSAWLTEVWPNWQHERLGAEIKKALQNEEPKKVLLLVGNAHPLMQSQLIRKIEIASAHELTLKGLFDAHANGLTLKKTKSSDPHVWFLVTNSYGQQKTGRITLNTDSRHEDLMMRIPSQIVESDDRPFSIDLKKFLAQRISNQEASFSLLGNSPGSLERNGIYTNKFEGGGQQAVLASVTIGNNTQTFAFDIEHGVIGHKEKFNHGFLFFFAGDKNALGFSQTYKRPVYDLLFGASPTCGDGKIDVGETCDNGTVNDDGGCTKDCFRPDESFLDRVDAEISGYIVSTGRIGNTIQLMLPALLLSLLLAIPLGVFSAICQYSASDYVISFLAFLGISLPVFWFGIMMIYVFAETFQLMPAGGVQTPGIYGEGIWAILFDRLKYAILPTIVLSIFYVGRWLRYMRAAMLEVLPMDYIRTARAKGLSEKKVILKHAFRNALIPVVTVLAISIPSLFGGAVLTETVFSWPGIGRLQYEAVMNSDYYVAIIVFLIEAILVMVGNLLADVAYVLVDPRIRKL